MNKKQREKTQQEIAELFTPEYVLKKLEFLAGEIKKIKEHITELETDRKI